MNTALNAFRTGLEEGECAVLFSRVSRQYLSRFRSSDGVLLVRREGAILSLDSRYLEMAQIRKQKGLLPAEVELRPAEFAKDFALLSEEGKAPRVYMEDRSVTYAKWASMQKSYPKSEFLPLGDRIEQLRAVKTEDEIRRIREAQALAEEAFLSVLPHVQKGRTEADIAAELEYYMKRHGASAPSFETICVSGSRSSLHHGRAEAVELGDGFVTMDFGCMLDGYASDMTRTVCIGKATEEMRRVYKTVLAAQKNALTAVRAGVLGSQVDRAARGIIEEAGYGAYFGHSTGHGIGLNVHEAPSFAPRFDSPIPAGAVLSVEPGIYLPGKFGVRIEDLCVVREDGIENLNRTSKELLEL